MASTFLFFKRLVRYCASGVVSVGVDAGLLLLFVELFHWYYLWAACLSFIIGQTTNYFISRHWNFKHVDREHLLAYMLFVGFGCFGLGVTLILMGVAVSKIGMHYIMAKLIVSIIVGFMNFLFNYYVTFKAHLVDFD